MARMHGTNAWLSEPANLGRWAAAVAVPIAPSTGAGRVQNHTQNQNQKPPIKKTKQKVLLTDGRGRIGIVGGCRGFVVHGPGALVRVNVAGDPEDADQAWYCTGSQASIHIR